VKYDAVFSRRAATAFDRLDQQTRTRIAASVQELLAEPQARGTKKLRGAKGQRSVRVGDFRVIYFVDHEARTVFVDAIGPRGRVYRDL
jgi:mRNA interferase RelE/StbE